MLSSRHALSLWTFCDGPTVEWWLNYMYECSNIPATKPVYVLEDSFQNKTKTLSNDLRCRHHTPFDHECLDANIWHLYFFLINSTFIYRLRSRWVKKEIRCILSGYDYYFTTKHQTIKQKCLFDLQCLLRDIIAIWNIPIMIIIWLSAAVRSRMGVGCPYPGGR